MRVQYSKKLRSVRSLGAYLTALALFGAGAGGHEAISNEVPTAAQSARRDESVFQPLPEVADLNTAKGSSAGGDDDLGSDEPER